MKKEDRKLAHDSIISLVSGLLSEHADGIVEAHQKMDNTLGVSIRLSLKHDEGKINLITSINYATDQVKDHANDVVDFEQKILEFEKKDVA